MEESLWGGRIVMTSVISTLLIVLSLTLPYYEFSHDEIYAVDWLNSEQPYSPGDLQLFSDWIGMIVLFCALLNLAYIGMVMKGVRWPSMYVEGLSIIILVAAMALYAYRADTKVAELELSNPSYTYSHAVGGGFLVLGIAVLGSVISFLMRGWVLGGKARKRLDILPEEDDEGDLFFSPESRTKD